MSLAPTLAELVARARTDLRAGVPIVLDGDGGRVLLFAVETLRPDRFAALPQGAVLALTARRAETLHLAAYDGDLVRLHLPQDVGLRWLHAMADPARDFDIPLKGPFVAVRDADADAARLGIALAKDARLLPAVLLVPALDLPEELTHLDIQKTKSQIGQPQPFAEVARARVPLSISEAGRLHVYRPGDGGEEHYVVEIGMPDRNAPVLTRLHSACFTGDVLGSLKCDCGPQLQTALRMMAGAGGGLLLYLNQEGRGIGLGNKMRAYDLQDQGFDTVEANHRLGFEDDERDFRIGAALLRQMNVSTVRLMTNNPAKLAMMERQGIAVTERVPLKIPGTRHSAAYLATKARKSGHLL